MAAVPSSDASASVTNASGSQVTINSDDPAWAHCSCPDPKKKYSLRCNYCNKLCTSGITRIKYHLAGVKGFNVTKCPSVPTPVKEEMLALIANKNNEKQQKAKEEKRARDEVDIDNSGDESCDEESDQENVVLVVKPKPTKGSSSSKSVVGGGSTIDKFYKPPSIEESVRMGINNKVQTTLTTQKREERRDRTCEYICQFFYEASIAHNAVTLPSFSNMLEAIGQFGKGLRGPTPYEMGGPFLKKRKQKVLDGFKSHKESWLLTGCSLMTDAWTDKKGRAVMNLVVHSAHGVFFLDSVDCSSEKKTGKYIFELVDRYIEEIGEENVVQVVTDNASVNTTAANLLTAKRPSIFWTGCAAHGLDLMLEEIGKLGPVEQTITNAREVTVFLYAHTRVLDLMRKFLKKDLVRFGVTRFATAYLNLKSLLDSKSELKKLFQSEELDQWGYLKKAKGKKAKKIVKSDTFWKNVDMAVNFFEPLANVLRRMDSDVPAMGFFHGLMIEAKKEISERFDNDESRFKEVWDIIDRRWDNKLKTPPHLAGYYLNPYYYYPKKTEIERDGSFRAAVITCTEKLFAGDEETQDSILEELSKYQDQEGTFGHDIAVRQRRNKNFNPAKWWMNHGTNTPNLKKLAVRILNLTCSSSDCERNWSSFEEVHTKKRNRLNHDKMRDLVFVKFNSKLRNKKENKGRDPLEKEVDDILGDDGNEFITDIGEPSELAEQLPQPRGSQEDSASQAQAQAQASRKRPGRPKKKKLRSINALMNGLEQQTSSDDSEDGDGDDSVQSSDSYE